jgi:hypothetical protein
VIGLSYRLIPMMLPAVMPAGRTIAISALLIEAGLAVLTWTLLIDASVAWLGAVLMIGGVGSFVAHVRRMLRRRLPRPPALPSRDWSVWQVHSALVWLLAALGSGLALSIGVPDDYRLALMWIYATAGLVGFLAQMVAGMQGRLVPLYAWYRAYAAAGSPPARSTHALPSAAFARAIFLCWAAAVPLLAWGLSQADQLAIRLGALILSGGLAAGGRYIIHMLRRAVPTVRTIPRPLVLDRWNQA